MTPAPDALDLRGGGPGSLSARRAVMRWAWRLFRREWRQQLLVLTLIVVVVGAIFVAAAVATNNPTPANLGFGTASDLATYQGAVPDLPAKVAALEHRFGRVQVIEDETLSIPGSVDTYQLRAESARGPFSGPMLSLVSGKYPTGIGEVALTKGVASAFSVRIGQLWAEGGTQRRVVGIVEDPLDTLDAFALVVPGQVRNPTEVDLLFDAPGVNPSKIGPNVAEVTSVALGAANPETIILAVAVIGMLLVTLIAAGGFTVLAQRRLRSLGMLSSIGATEKQVRAVVRTNGAVVGIAGTLLGALFGFIVWLIYRPTLETSSFHVIGTFALPWDVIGPVMGLAVVAAYAAARRPARAVAKVPIVSALSGRPVEPRRVHRSAIPGVVLLGLAFVLLGYSTTASSAKPNVPFLIGGLISLVPGVILLAPFFLSFAAGLGRHAPIATRLALRDLARYRARSGPSLAAISIAVLITVIVAVAAAARYGNVLDYAGPNLASNQVVVYAPLPGGTPLFGPNGPSTAPNPPPMAVQDRRVHEIAEALGAESVIPLEQTNAYLNHLGTGRNWSGPIYVATPRLLREFGITSSEIDPSALILSVRPGLSGVSNMQFTWSPTHKHHPKGRSLRPPSANGRGGNVLNTSTRNTNPCPKSSCRWNPRIEELSGLPSGTSAPNTVITEHAIHSLGLQTSLAGWFITTVQPPTASQIRDARLLASKVSGMSIETKNSAPSGSEVIDSATLAGIVLALAILAMSVGLIRSETASDLRTLAATGASSRTRRAITAATAGSLGFLGALLGTAAGYVAMIGFIRTNSLNGGISALGNVPTANLLEILVAMPLAAAVVGWLLAGREPPAIARQPIE
jgi:putative ABC transport system permease protein